MAILKQGESDAPVGTLYREHGMSSVSYYWAAPLLGDKFRLAALRIHHQIKAIFKSADRY